MYLPGYSPELNSLENCWEFIKSRYLKNRVFQNIDDIIDAASEAWNNFVDLDGQMKNTCSRQWANIAKRI